MRIKKPLQNRVNSLQSTQLYGMLMKSWLLLLVLILNPWFLTADDGRGLYFDAQCDECHGSKGVSTDSRYPSLAGLKQSQLVSQLAEF